MDRVEWIKYEGQRILRIDLSGVAPVDHDLVVEILKDARVKIDQEPPDSVRLMTDLSSSRYDFQFIELAKKFMQNNKKYVMASAIVGTSKLASASIAAISMLTGRNVKTFDDLAAAKEWLSRI